MKKYDFVYLTNTPSFYKINLCNEIAKRHSLLLVLYGYGAEAVNYQLGEHTNYRFDFQFLHQGDAAKRNKAITFFKLVKLILGIKYQKLLYAGWFVPEYNLLSFFTSRKKNCVICESSILDSSVSGITGFIKRTIINRMSVALPSGELHKEIFKQVNFKGTMVATGGVGIFNKQKRIQRKAEAKK